MENYHDRIRDIFIGAAEKPAEERALYLDEMCRDDAELRKKVERLIEADGSKDSFFAQAPASTAAIPRFPIGSILAERFRVVSYIAAGGMGDVYEVDDLALNARLAIKTIRSDLLGNKTALARFKREIQCAKQVTHPNVCRIHDLGSHHEGSAEIVFLTMELLHGQTLAERLRTIGRMPPEDALPLVVQMAEGLAAAHEVGIIHRDFKTSNVILAESSAGTRAVVTDFGLARPTDSNEGASLTESGKIVGTPTYMAPEQITHGKLTCATDVYALGLVMYEMITGRRPFSGSTPLDSAVKRLTQPPPSPSKYLPGLDPRWEIAIMRCLEREPARRYQTPREVARVLTESAAPTRTLTNVWMHGGGRRIGRITAIAGIAGLAVLLAGGVGLWFIGRHRPPAEAVRWYEEGTRALRDGTSFTAMKAFERAVQLDGDFTLAHARLAEAATELDYMDKAQSEMLRASPPAYQSFFLSPEEKLRLEAVYFSLVKDPTRATAAYKELASKVGSAERAAVLVDLGRAYESAGKFPEALASYSESAQRDRQFAAAFLRRGILEGRQQQSAKAASDFNVAEQLYSTEGKAEGLTEVLYQRSSLLRRSGKLAEARAPNEKSLELARASGDEYHQIRALLALSYLSYNSGDTEGGQEQAQQAIDLARRAGIDVLAASGLVDIGNALFSKGDIAAAEPYLRNAVEAAKRFQAVVVEARAELTLGQVLAKEGRTEEAVAVSKAAVADFQQAGETSNAARAAIPVSRMLRDQGDYEAAAGLFRQQLQLAEQVKDDGGIAFALQGLGSVLLSQEQYPAALALFDRCVAVSHAIANLSQEGYSQVNRADVLWPLGRYREAIESLKNAEAIAQRMGGNKPLLATIDTSRASMDVSHQRFTEAEEDIRQMLGAAVKGPATSASAKRLLGLVRVGTGRAHEATGLCEESVQQARETMNVPLLKNAELALAEAKLQSGDPAGARMLATNLAKYFATKGQNASEFRALALAAAASQGDSRTSYVAGAKTALERLRQGLGAEAFTGFVSRPDIHAILVRVGLISDIR
jgi:tetratricopeptide (TPR) repeat protein/tRNA A-37 threonylcarbamoyl transferase component Bud32